MNEEAKGSQVSEKHEVLGIQLRFPGWIIPFSQEKVCNSVAGWAVTRIHKLNFFGLPERLSMHASAAPRT